MSVPQAHQSLEELTDALRDAIEASTADGSPEEYSYDFVLAPNALLPLLRPLIGPYADGGAQDLPDGFKTTWEGLDESGERGPAARPISSVQNLVEVTEASQRNVVQRAGSRGIKDAIEGVDGFRYSFNNGWAAGATSGKPDGFRFSWICQDSMQNKDRHANGAPRTQKNKRSGEKGYIRKPTYDCKGNICIKFSLSRGVVVVIYRHLMIHPTVAQRKANPVRPSRSGIEQSTQHMPPKPFKATPLNEVLQNEHARDEVGNESASSQPSMTGVKRKRNGDVWGRPVKLEPVLSLAELLKRSVVAGEPPTIPSSKSTRGHVNPPPVHYDLPIWQTSMPANPDVYSSTKQSSERYPPPHSISYTPTQRPQPKLRPPQAQHGVLVPHHGLRSTKRRTKPPSVIPASGQSMFITLKQTPLNEWQPRRHVMSRPFTIRSCMNCGTDAKTVRECRGRPRAGALT